MALNEVEIEKSLFYIFSLKPRKKMEKALSAQPLCNKLYIGDWLPKERQDKLLFVWMKDKSLGLKNCKTCHDVHQA